MNAWAQNSQVPDIAAATGSKVVSSFKVTPLIAGKTAASFALGAAGIYYLARGKEDGDVGKMVWGMILAIASIFVFV